MFSNIGTPKHSFSIWNKWKINVLGVPILKHVRVQKLSFLIFRSEVWPRGYKTFFMLYSVEHEILNAHKYNNIKKFGIFMLR